MGQVFQHAEQYLDRLGAGQFVEIGTSRNGDDGSTKTLSKWAVDLGRHLTTVDMDPVNCQLVETWNLPNTTVVNSTGKSF